MQIGILLPNTNGENVTIYRPPLGMCDGEFFCRILGSTISAYSTSHHAQHTQIIGPCVANRCYVAKGYYTLFT